MLAHIPALGSAFLGGAPLYFSIYLPTPAIIFPAILAGCGTMVFAYSYRTLRQITRFAGFSGDDAGRQHSR
jgi:hypothetical protein